MFIDNCHKNYKVGAYVTIDEQLIPFRGRVGFRQYIPSKPDKYGMKLFLLCDCASGYTFNGMPYVGREDNGRHVGLAEHVVKTLVEPLHYSGINVTTDNWFTSTKLAADLLLKQITLLGTLKKNKSDIPSEFAASNKSEVGSSLFGFCDRQTLTSFVPKKNKAVVLLSTMHSDNDVDQESGKPVMIMDYNKTKAGVDRVDQLCHSYSVQKRTKRWPLAYFYNCLNVAGINAQVVYMAKFPDWEAGKSHRRRLFLQNLGMLLLQPWLERRAQIPYLNEPIKRALESCGYARRKPQKDEFGPQKRRRCHICPSALDHKTPNRCSVCNEPYCNEHKTTTITCTYCSE